MEIDNLICEVFLDRKLMGLAAAKEAANLITNTLQKQNSVRIIFAAAPSQQELLAGLLRHDIEWQKVTAFHMDEYIGLNADAPQGFGNFLRKHIFSHAPFRAVHYLDGNAPDLQQECLRYSNLLSEAPIDLVLLGVGENGHIAFNDPPVANFTDPQLVKIVELDQICRQQQVNDACFSVINEVPSQALTLTVPALFTGDAMICVVPGKSKAQAIKMMLRTPVSTACPASILRQHSNAKLFFDQDAASEIG